VADPTNPAHHSYWICYDTDLVSAAESEADAAATSSSRMVINASAAAAVQTTCDRSISRELVLCPLAASMLTGAHVGMSPDAVMGWLG
jgi:hypothetical protein